ncbi:MAG: rhodanese-like domain-containing protein [Bdellovibrionales bacterium]
MKFLRLAEQIKLKEFSLVIYFAVLVLSFQAACVQVPTKIYTNEEFDTSILARGLKSKIVVDENTFIIDARSDFEFAIAHFPQAIHLSWSDFTDAQEIIRRERGTAALGRVKKDIDPILRRLALYGLSLDSKIIIVGKANKGDASEGILAWMFLYLGFKNVQTAQIDTLGIRYSNLLNSPKPNVLPWEAKIRHSLVASRDEIKSAAISKHDDKVHIIDVRSKDEYFNKNSKLQYQMPDIRAIHIEWKEFYSNDGRPNQGIRKQLESVNISRNDRILVISNRGLRSAAATYALLALGFSKAANYDGGYEELVLE